MTYSETKQTTCPSCHKTSTFTLIGVQEWPVAVAERAGLPTSIGLYQCEHCHSTISDIDLNHSPDH